MRIELNKAHFPVTALGPGRRLGLWLQGCSIRCRGCVSRDTWEPDSGKGIGIDELVAWCRAVSAPAPDGVTISGGEPFDQPQALDALLAALGAWREEAALDFDLLCYSGYGYERLARRHAGILARLDAIVSEPYVEDRPTDAAWRGSANQRLVPLSPRGAARYGGDADFDEKRRFQFVADGSRVWFVGIPRAGDLARLETACAARGLDLGLASWRA